ncbi:uncharacterized protein LOC143909221 [Arctopsyche grandis]|uniref:uncharacterized protein LOC143909221 n=1 Tax=Arctopsyche grandis TaxID=121162 RepID=UPI00406D6960
MSMSGGGGAIGGSFGVLSERDRRLLRLRQVREQSKEIAKNLRLKWKDEQNKLISDSKQMEFENFNKNTIQTLKRENENRYLTIGTNQSAVLMQENQKREWLQQKERNMNKALERGKSAFDIMRKNRRIQGDERKKLEYKRWESPRKSRSPTISTGNTNISKKSSNEKINQFYEESEGADNCCSNFQHHLEINSNNRFPLSIPGADSGDSNTALNKKRVTISGEFSSLAMKNNPSETSNKHSEIETTLISPESESKTKSHEELAIQKALCDCRPHFKSIATNVEHLFNNNHNDKHTKNASESTEKVSSRIITANQEKQSSEYASRRDDTNESTKYIPLTIVSDYLKSRNMCFEDDSRDCNDKIGEIDVEYSRKDSLVDSAGHVERKKRPDCKEDSTLRSSKTSKTTVMIKHNIKRKPSTLNVEKIPSRNIRLGKPSNLKLKSSVSNKEFTSLPRHSERSINSYDQVNKFSKKLFINDKYLVKRLPREIHNAYENARREAEEEEAIAAAIHAARMNDKSKNRGAVALERVRAKDDYKNLLEELDVLTKEERLIGKAFPDKIFKNTTRTRDEIKHQNFMDMTVKHMFNEFHTNEKVSATNNGSENICMRSNSISASNLILSDQNDTAVNVAMWDVSKSLNSKNKTDVSSKGSESSVQSIVFQKLNTTANQNHKKDVAANDEDRIITKSTTELVNKHSNSTEDEETRNKTTKKCSKKAKLSSANKRSLINGDNASSVTNTVSFEGLQIVIEVKNAKRETSNVIKTSKTKNEGIQTVERSDLSSEVSIKTSKMVSSRKVTVEKVNCDSSESTTYMSPPERFDKMFSRGFPIAKDSQMNTSNDLHTCEFITKDIAVNTDLDFNDYVQITSHSNTLEEISHSRRPAESLTCASKGIQVDLVNNSNVEIDPRLRNYVMTLLDMSESEVKKLNIDVSNIHTPNSTIINMPANKEALTRDVDKIERLKKFIQENYALLEDFETEESILSPHESETHSKTISKLDDKPSNLLKTDMKEAVVDKKNKNKRILEDAVETSSRESIDDRSSFSVAEDKIDTNRIRSIPIQHEVKKKREVNAKCDQNSTDSSDDKDMLVVLHHEKSEAEADRSESENAELNQLSDECARRILDLSQKLNQVRREKHSIVSSNASSSSEESTAAPRCNKTALTGVAFVPLLADIPKPNNNADRMTRIDGLIEGELHSSSQDRDFNSNEFRKALVVNRNRDIFDVTPRELSTIMEVDTPATARNSSSHFRSVNPSYLVSAKLAGREITLDHLPDLSIPKLEDSVQVEANFNSFISFKDFIRRNETKLGQFLSNSKESSSSSDDSLKKSLKSGYSSDNSNSSISEAIVSNKSLLLQKMRSSFNEVSNPKCDISTHSLTPELEKLIQSFGLDWELTTRKKKTQQAQTLSSSNSSSQIFFDKLELLGKTVDGTDNTRGLATLQDDLKLSDELPIGKKIVENISNLSLYKKLDSLLNAEVCKVQQIRGKESNKENYPTLSDRVAKSGGKDKTQHRTSTPVHFKSSMSSNARNSFTNNGSNCLFNADSDLSSVKNASNSDDRLSVPNVSLRFGKLFDSSTLNADTQ